MAKVRKKYWKTVVPFLLWLCLLSPIYAETDFFFWDWNELAPIRSLDTNPAVLADIEHFEGRLDIYSLRQDSTGIGLDSMIPLGPWTVGLTYHMVSMDDLKEVADMADGEIIPSVTGTIVNRYHQFDIHALVFQNTEWTFTATARALAQELYTESAFGGSVDFSGLYRISDTLSVGGSTEHLLHRPITWSDDTKYTLKPKYFGQVFWLAPGGHLLLAQMEAEEIYFEGLKVAGDFRIIDTMSVSLAAEFDSGYELSRYQISPSMGLGYNLRLRYTYSEALTYAGLVEHVFSLSWGL